MRSNRIPRIVVFCVSGLGDFHTSIAIAVDYLPDLSPEPTPW
jgi:hypothetical protein